MGFQLPFPQLVSECRISEPATIINHPCLRSISLHFQAINIKTIHVTVRNRYTTSPMGWKTNAGVLNESTGTVQYLHPPKGVFQLDRLGGPGGLPRKTREFNVCMAGWRFGKSHPPFFVVNTSSFMVQFPCFFMFMFTRGIYDLDPDFFYLSIWKGSHTSDLWDLESPWLTTFPVLG